MVIVERDESLLNFFTPAVLVVIGLLVLSLGAIGFLLVAFVIPIMVPDAIIASIQLNLFGQIIGVIVTLFFLIPFFRIKKVKTNAPTVWRVLKVLGISCFILTFITFVAFILYVIFTALGLPIEHSYESLILTPAHLANPWNIVLFFATATIGAAIFEELIYRRMLIPLLEGRGMSPTAAVIASGLAFALIHVPNDVINGSLGYVISHFITTFTLGLFFGFIYVFTRNVIFPMIIHGFTNTIAFSELILFSLGDMNLLVILALIILGIWIIGIIIGGLALFQFFKEPSPAWVITLRQQSKINILPGLAGYLIVAFGLVSFQVLIELGIDALFFPNFIMIYLVLFLFYLVFVLVLLWIIHNTRYEEPPPEPEETRTLYDRASEVTLEPLQDEAE